MSKCLLIVKVSVDPAKEQEFNRWYHEEYLPRLVKIVPEMSNVRRFCSQGEGQRHFLTVYEFDDEAAMNTAFAKLGSPERASDREAWHRWMHEGVTVIAEDTYYRIYPRDD